MTKRFSSFEQVDEQLKILRLQRDIYAERIKLDFNGVISNINFYPVQFMERVGTALQKLALVFVIKKLRNLFIK